MELLLLGPLDIVCKILYLFNSIVNILSPLPDTMFNNISNPNHTVCYGWSSRCLNIKGFTECKIILTKNLKNEEYYVYQP